VDISDVQDEPLGTINKPGEKAKPAPFVPPRISARRVGFWCEWIAYWPNKKARDALEALATTPSLSPRRCTSWNLPQARKTEPRSSAR